MKKIIYSAMAVAMLATTSCKDDFAETFVGDQATVEFSISTPEIGTRAFSEGELVDHLHYAIYEVEGQNLIKTSLFGTKDFEQNSRVVNLSLPLKTDKEYKAIFWADDEDAPYTVTFDTDRATMAVDYTDAKANDERRDAFYACVPVVIRGNESKTITLTRPFAQLNIGTNDYDAAANAGYTPTLSSIKVYAYSGMDLMTGNVTGNQEIKIFDYAPIPGKVDGVRAENFPVADYDYLAMTYILVGDDVTSEVTFGYKEDAAATEETKTVGSVPLKRNYRTNIYGGLLTGTADINVEIEPSFDGDENKEIVEVATATQLQEAINKGGNGETIILTGDIDLNDLFGPNQAPTRAGNTDPTLTIAEGKNLTLDLNGKKLYATSAVATSNREMFLVKGGLTVKNGTIEYKHIGDNMGRNSMSTIFDVTAGGVVNLEGVTAMNLGGTDLAFVAHLNNWGEVTLNVNNSTLKSTYIAVRAFNSGNDMNNVTIKNSTLEGKYCFWVHNFKAAGDSNGSEETLNIDIFDGTNTFSYTDNAPVLYGFDNPIYFDEDGYSADDNGNVTIVAAAGLKKLASQVNGGTTFQYKTVKLLGNIDLKGENWTPIGTSAYPYKGIFDGNNHTIKNLVIDGGSKSDIGLFGFTTEGEIKNLVVENANVSGRLNVGVVAGTPYTSKYTNITVKGHVEVNGMAYVGAVGGKNAYANWTNITVNADETSYVNANSVENGVAYRTYVGGVVGFMGEGGHTMRNVTSNIDVKGSTIDVGGIVGIAHYGNNFVNVTCTGDVEIYAADDAEEAQEIGGIAGVWHNETGTTVTMTNCNFTGQLKANNNYVINTTKFGNLVCAAYNTTGEGKLIIDGTEYSALYGALTPVKTADELVAALSEGKGVYLLNDITIAATNGGYSKAGILQNKAQTIHGGGHTLTVTGAGATWECAIYTNGGIIRNLTVAGAMRGIFTAGQSSDLFIDNVVFKNVVYTFNSDGTMPANPFGVYFTESTINGWTSHSNMHTEVVYKNCSFGEGSGYKYCRPYGKTAFVNCTFCAGYTVDQSQTTEITFTDCTWK